MTPLDLEKTLALHRLKTSSIVGAAKVFAAVIEADVPEGRLKSLLFRRLRSLAVLADRAKVDPPVILDVPLPGGAGHGKR